MSLSFLHPPFDSYRKRHYILYTSYAIPGPRNSPIQCRHIYNTHFRLQQMRQKYLPTNEQGFLRFTQSPSGSRP